MTLLEMLAIVRGLGVIKGRLKMKETHEDLINEIKKVISPIFQTYHIEKQDGVGLLQIFDEENMVPREENKFKVANADIVVFDDNKTPFLIIEPETSGSPKTFGKSISIYTIAKMVRVGGKKVEEYSIESPLLLLIVIPQHPENSQKEDQLDDLRKKLKMTIDLRNSQLKDFDVCQIDNVKPTLRKLLNNNGYKNYGGLID